MLLLTSITAKKKTQRCHTKKLATTGLMRFSSPSNVIAGKKIPQKSVVYLPRGFEGNNQRLQSSSTGPVGQRTKSEKVMRNFDHEFRHNIVKVAVDSRGDSRVVPQITLTML